MNRRNFLKLSAVTGLAALVPLEFIIDNRDGETKFFDYIITHYDEVQVIDLVKIYGWKQSRGRITDFFRGLVQRQPHLVSWLKERIKLRRDADGDRYCSNPKYDYYRNNVFEHNRVRALTDKIYPELERKFNLRPKELSTKKMLA